MGKLLGKLGHQHLIAALIVPVCLLNVGEQGIPHDLPQGKAHNLAVYQEHPPQHIIGVVVVQHLPGLGQVLVERGGRLIPPCGIPVQERLHLGDVLWGDHPEGPGAVGLQKFVHMVALAAELLTPEKFQILRPVEVVEGIPVSDGGAVGKGLLQAVQLIPWDWGEGNGHIPAAAVVRDLPVVLRPSAPKGQCKGGAQTRVVHLKIEGAVIDRPLRLVQVPPDKDGTRSCVTDPAAAVLKEVAELRQVLQL